jgi:ABC-type enterochelin transport system permease subunit
MKPEEDLGGDLLPVHDGRLEAIGLVLVTFVAFSVLVTAGEPFFGFITLALRDKWGAQVLVDLVIACTLFMVWMVPDARARKIPAWPYVILILALGSIGSLAYLLHRALRAPARLATAS